MKKSNYLFGCVAFLFATISLLFTGCKPTTSGGTNSTFASDYEIKITKDNLSEWALWKYDLKDYGGKTVDITFSVEAAVENNSGKEISLSFPVNQTGYPEITGKKFPAGKTEWTKITATKKNFALDENKVLYLSNNELSDLDLTIYLKNVSVKVKEAGTISEDNWLSSEVPSLYQTYKDYFDYFGFAVEYGNNNKWTELYYEEIQNGLKKHANTISLGNEFKPDFVFNWGWWRTNKDSLVDFTASNGKTIKVPNNIPTFELQDEILQLCKDMNVHMRGHVLLWHSQTPAQFFYEDFGYPLVNNNPSNTTMVDAETMDARLEWYIKTVIEHCDTYKLADGTPVIWAWDVANEATSDGSQSDAATSTDYTHWLRTSGSNWYTVYKAAEDAGKTNYYTNTTYKAYDFVINAFRFANKYAKPGTKLVYNDYGGLTGTSTSKKHDSQMRLVQYILDHNSDAVPTRIDAMGLQSHYSVQNSAAAYEKEITDFIGKGLDVQITELDIASCAKYDPETDTVGCDYKQFDSIADAYYGFMQMFIKNRKTSSKAGVSCVTIWGLSDQQTWLNTIEQNQWIGSCQQYPLLFNLENNVKNATNTYEYYTDSTKTNKKSFTLESFDDGDSYTTKPAFYSVIKAATEYTE